MAPFVGWETQPPTILTPGTVDPSELVAGIKRDIESMEPRRGTAHLGEVVVQTRRVRVVSVVVEADGVVAVRKPPRRQCHPARAGATSPSPSRIFQSGSAAWIAS